MNSAYKILLEIKKIIQSKISTEIISMIYYHINRISQLSKLGSFIE